MDIQQEWPYVDVDWINFPHNLGQALVSETAVMRLQVPWKTELQALHLVCNPHISQLLLKFYFLIEFTHSFIPCHVTAGNDMR
jgi:hypothetical protein